MVSIQIYIYKVMRILKPFMLLAVIGVLYSCAAVPLQTYRNGYIMDKNNVVVGSIRMGMSSIWKRISSDTMQTGIFTILAMRL